MTKNDILTVHEIDAFTARLKATAAAAHESQSLLSALSRLVKGGAQTDGVAHPSSAQAGTKPGRGGKRGKRAGNASSHASGASASSAAAAPTGRRGRAPRVDDSQILELLRQASGGATMRDLEGSLGQHVETIRLKLRTLRQGGQVHTSGPRNQLRYHASDSDGVATPASDAAAAPKKTRGRPARAKAAAKTAAAPAPTKGRRRGRAAAPAPEGLTERLVAVLRGAGMDGVQMSTFEAETKQPAKTIRKVLETMRQANQVMVTGQRRSTRYHAGS